MVKVISFSLWGNDPKYCVGAIRNAELAAEIFPGWTCRFYIGKSVPFEVTETLTANVITKDWVRKVLVDGKWIPMCGGSMKPPKIEIYHMPEEGDWRGMFWRFDPATDPKVEAMISRDCDSRLSLREAAAVEEWLASGKGFHIMRDHPWHGSHMLGGMWGCRGAALPEFKELMAAWNQEDRWQTDQDFLNKEIYPRIVNDSMIHASFFKMEHHAKEFPMPRNDTEFVGQVFDENEATVQEHLTALARTL